MGLPVRLLIGVTIVSQPQVTPREAQPQCTVSDCFLGDTRPSHLFDLFSEAYALSRSSAACGDLAPFSTSL